MTQELNRNPEGFKYSGLGSILQSGLQFNAPKEREFEWPQQLTHSQDWMKHENSTKVKDKDKPKTDVYYPHLQLHLPKNIQHQFGTKACDRLLADVQKVNESLRMQQKSQSAKKSVPPQERDVVSSTVLSDYEALGCLLRQDVFPGKSCDDQVGVIKGDFNAEVHRNRVAETDRFRYRKDELSKWAEYRLLQEQVKRAWDARQALRKTNDTPH